MDEFGVSFKRKQNFFLESLITPSATDKEESSYAECCRNSVIKGGRLSYKSFSDLCKVIPEDVKKILKDSFGEEEQEDCLDFLFDQLCGGVREWFNQDTWRLKTAKEVEDIIRARINNALAVRSLSNVLSLEDYKQLQLKREERWEDRYVVSPSNEDQKQLPLKIAPSDNQDYKNNIFLLEAAGDGREAISQMAVLVDFFVKNKTYQKFDKQGEEAFVRAVGLIDAEVEDLFSEKKNLDAYCKVLNFLKEFTNDSSSKKVIEGFFKTLNDEDLTDALMLLNDQRMSTKEFLEDLDQLVKLLTKRGYGMTKDEDAFFKQALDDCRSDEDFDHDFSLKEEVDSALKKIRPFLGNGKAQNAAFHYELSYMKEYSELLFYLEHVEDFFSFSAVLEHLLEYFEKNNDLESKFDASGEDLLVKKIKFFEAVLEDGNILLSEDYRDHLSELLSEFLNLVSDESRKFIDIFIEKHFREDDEKEEEDKGWDSAWGPNPNSNSSSGFTKTSGFLAPSNSFKKPDTYGESEVQKDKNKSELKKEWKEFWDHVKEDQPLSIQVAKGFGNLLNSFMNKDILLSSVEGIDGFDSFDRSLEPGSAFRVIISNIKRTKGLTAYEEYIKKPLDSFADFYQKKLGSSDAVDSIIKKVESL